MVENGMRARDATCAAPYEVSEITPAAAVADAVRETNEAIGAPMRATRAASRTAVSKTTPAATAKIEYRTASIWPFAVTSPTRWGEAHSLSTCPR